MSRVIDALYGKLPGQQHRMDEFVGWARENAIVFESSDGMLEDSGRLSYLDELLKDKKILYLGEEDHWIHEKTQYRLTMLRYLVSRGWNLIGEELGWSDGVRIDRYLETGDEKYLQRIATYGYGGDARKDRDDRPTGLLKEISSNYPLDGFRTEQLAFAGALRELSEELPEETGRIRFFGFDINAVPGGGYEDILELLKPVRNEPELEKLLPPADPVPGETVEQEIGRLDRILDLLNIDTITFEEMLGEKRTAFLQQHILVIRESLDYMRRANPALDYRTLNKAMAVREMLMYSNVEFMLSRMGPEDKLVLLGHNRHLSKDIGSIRRAGASPPGGRLVPSLGTHLNHQFPGKVFSVWMLFGHGRSSQPFSRLSGEYSCKPDSLNALLAKAGSAYLLPTQSGDKRARLLKKGMDINGLYNIDFHTSISKQADAIFFFNEVQPLGYAGIPDKTCASEGPEG